MIFNSIPFLIFFGIVWAAYYAAPERARWLVLLLASLAFYAWSEPLFLIQILAITYLTFRLGQAVENGDAAAKRRLTTVGIVLLVCNLAVFKYTSFLNETFRSLFGLSGIPYPVPVIEILLPIGISFYTFQLIAYLVDVRRGLPSERHAGIFILSVLYFPKIIAGPIERAKSLLPQLHAAHPFDYAQAVTGLQLFLWGLFKKVVIADRIAPFVAQVYDQPTAHDGVTISIATWLYAFQIYCDFSGYTDMALGMSAIFGIRLMQNFNRPYFATSIQDFWKRWHISLTSWLTDYVYTPLSRQRKFKIKLFHLILVSLFLTFVVSGLWHGAQWTFVAWGALHGAYIVVSLLSQKARASFCHAVGLAARPRLHRAIKVATTFSLVCFAYILFRANTMTDAWHMMTHLLVGWGGAVGTLKEFVAGNHSEFALALLGIGFMIGVESFGPRLNVMEQLQRKRWLRWTAYYAGTVSVLLLGAFYGLDQQFIYFRF